MRKFKSASLKALLACACSASVLLPQTVAFLQAEATEEIINDSDARITYSEGTGQTGGWTAGNTGGTYENSEHWANVAGASFTFTFTGNALELYGPKKTAHKKISVKIDEHDPITVDCYGTENQNGLLLYNSRTDGPAIEQGEHTVLVTVLDESNPDAQNATGVAFNYAKVYSEPPVELVETSIADSDASLTYSSGWNPGTGEHWVRGADHTIEFDFTGVGVDVIGVSDPSHRYMSIQIDDLDPIEFDCWSTERTPNTTLFSSLNAGVRLKQGKHHAVISTIAKRNDSCTEGENAAGVSFQGLKIYSEPEKQLYETILNDADTSRITYSEGTGHDTGWTGQNQSGSYESSEHWAQGVGSWLSFTFTGTALDIYGIKDDGHRYMQIQIDDLDPIEFDCYTPGRVVNTLLFSSREAGVELEQGLHAVRIETIAKVNEAVTAAKPGVSFQYAKLYSETEAAEEPVFEGFSFVEDMMATTEHEPFKIQYLSGAWGGGGAHYPDLFHDGYEHYSNDLGASYEMTFTGTKVELYGDKNAKHGTYTIEIDGEKVGEADASTTGETLRQQLLFATEELSDAEHTIRVTLADTEGNQNKAIQLDYLKVTHNVTAPTALKLPASMRLAPEASYSLEAEVIPWVAFDQDLLWSSSDRSVATVYNGKIHTAAVTEKKQTTITVRSKANPSVQANMILTVDPAKEMLNAFVGDEKRLDLSEDNASLLLGEGDSFHATAWRNDTVASKLVVAAQDKDLKNVTATASAFTNAEGETLPADAITLSWLEEVNANIGRGNASAPVKAFPDKIGTSATRDIDAGESGFVWASFNIGKEVKPGLYSGTISVNADGLSTPIAFNYSIEVIDLLLEEAQSDLQLWQHPYSVANYYLALGGTGATSNDFNHDFYFTDAHFALMKAEMEDYAKAGGHDVVANIVEEAWNHQSYYGDPSMVTWTKNADGSWSFDYTNYDKWIDFMIECGVLDPANGIGAIKCYSIVPWNNTVRYFDAASNSQQSVSLSPGSDAFNELWTTFLEDFLAHSEAKGWLDLTYISMDERDLSQMRPAGELVKSVKNEKGQSFKLSSAINADYTKPENYVFTDLIDDISVNLGSVENEAMKTLTAHRKELGLHTTIYTCTGDYPGNFTISDPGDNYWSVWYAMSTGTDGYMKWAFDNYVYDMTDNITYRYWEPGDGWFIYPESREGFTQGEEKGFVSTPRYEMLKKGVRDVTKAKVLLESDDVSEETKSELAAVIDAMSKPAKTTKYGSATYASAAARDSVHAQTAAIMEKVEKAEKEAAVNQYVIDKAPLQALVNEADGKKANGLLNGVLDSAVKAFDKALADAKAVLANDDAAKAEVKAAKKALEDAMAALEKVDKSQLQAAVNAANALDLADYIDNDAKTAFSQALQAAKDVLKVDAVLQENTVADTLKALQDAQKNLVKKADKTALNAAIAQAETKKTDGSLNGVLAAKISAFETALSEAKAAAAKDDLLQPEADAKTKALNDAMDDLVKVDKSGLQAAVNAAKALDLNTYEDGSEKAVFLEALKDAEDVLKADAVLQENTVADALKALDDAKADLKKKAVIHTELLQTAVQLADSLQSDAFADAKNLADSLASAKGVLENPESQEQVDQAAKALNQALLGLRYSVSEAKLNAIK